MLSFKLVLCLYVTQSFVFGKIVSKFYSGEKISYEVTPKSIHTQSEILKSDNVCPPDKSLNSENDVRVMIDFLYKQLSINEQLMDAYKSQAEKMRDNYMQDLKQFIEWFQYQPEHLKHVLEGLGQVRIQLIEPNVKNIANILKDNSKLDKLFKDKYDQLRKLLKRQKRYETICSFNCEEIEEHHIFKREVQNQYYCSSLEELHNKITQKLNDTKVQMQNNMINQVSTYSENYKTNINEIKNNLKNKALQEFGRTMYDILILQDDYHHFVEDLNITILETDIFAVKNLSIQLDDKLLQLQKAIERYGQYCTSCGDEILIRKSRKTDVDIKDVVEDISSTIVDRLIDLKFNETKTEIKNDWDKIFKDLNDLIQQVKEEDTNLALLKPIQEDVVNITREERKAFENIKNIAPQSAIKSIHDLVEKSQTLLQNVGKSLTDVESLIKK